MGYQPKHTPGPWFIGRSCDNTPGVMVPVPSGEGSGFILAYINRLPRGGAVFGDMDANARLIAAAPELATVLVYFHGFAKSRLAEMDAEDLAQFARASAALTSAGVF